MTVSMLLALFLGNTILLVPQRVTRACNRCMRDLNPILIMMCRSSELNVVKIAAGAIYTVFADFLNTFSHMLSVFAAPRLLISLEKHLMQP